MRLNKYSAKYVVVIASLIFNISYAAAVPSVFDFTENDIETSPLTAKSLKLAKGENVIDFDVSRIHPEVATIIKDSAGKQRIMFWQIGKSDTEVSGRSRV